MEIVSFGSNFLFLVFAGVREWADPRSRLGGLRAERNDCCHRVWHHHSAASWSSAGVPRDVHFEEEEEEG